MRRRLLRVLRMFGLVLGTLLAATDAAWTQTYCEATSPECVPIFFDGLTISSGQLLFPDGTVTAPGAAFKDETGTGLYRGAATSLDIAVNGAQQFRFGETNNTTYNHLLFGNDNLTDIGASGATRPRDVFIGDDTVVGDLVAFGGLTSAFAALDGSGDDLVLKGGDNADGAATMQFLLPDGAAATPSLSFENDPDTGLYSTGSNVIRMTTGGTQQWALSGTSLAPIADNSEDIGDTIRGVKTLYLQTSTQDCDTTTLAAGSATDLVRITVAAGAYVGGAIDYTVYANDATDFQMRSARQNFAVVNKAGTETCVISAASELLDGSVVAASAGTLTYGVTCTSSVDGTVDIEINAVSSLTETTLESCSRVYINSGTATVTPQ